jgi:Ca2+-binding RTX toxin-like protein
MRTSRLVRTVRAAGAGLVALVLVVPAGARAATEVSIERGAITAQGDGAANVVTLARSGNVFAVTDTTGVTALPGCTAAGNTATCPAAGVDSIDVLGGPGNDTLTVDPGSELGADVSVDGEEGDDRLRGGVGDDEFVDSAGNDTYNGGGGGDTFLDGPGNDTYAGGTDDDPFQSTDVMDFSKGQPGVTVTLDAVANDGPAGQANNVGSDIEAVVGTPGDDTITGGPSPDDFEGEGGNDVLAGNGGNDALAGGPGNDRLVGGPGDDELDDSEGNDDMVGGDGDDTAIIVQALALTISLDDQPNDGAGGEAKNVHSDVENVTTGPGTDKITGSAAVNRLDGGPGDDQIDGRGGVDTLKGGAGDDRIVAADGGPDAVICADGADTVTGDAVDALSDCESVTTADPGTTGGPGGPAGSDTVKPTVRISGLRAAVSRRSFLRGLRMTIATSEPATVVAELLAAVRSGGSIPFAATLGDVAIGGARLPLGSETRRLTLKPSSRFARRVRNHRLRLTVRLTVTDRAGNVTVATRRVRVR